MGGLIRLVSGRGLVVLALLAGAVLLGSPRMRVTATRLLACGVSLQAGDATGNVGASAASAIAGTRVGRASPGQCLREALRTTAAAKTWVQHHAR